MKVIRTQAHEFTMKTMPIGKKCFLRRDSIYVDEDGKVWFDLNCEVWSYPDRESIRSIPIIKKSNEENDFLIDLTSEFFFTEWSEGKEGLKKEKDFIGPFSIEEELIKTLI